MRPKMIFIVADRNRTERILHAAEEAGLNYLHVMPALGTARSLLGEVTGTGETEKSLITGFANGTAIPELWEILDARFGFGQKDSGIAFTVPLSGVGGPASLRILAGSAAEGKYGI